MMIGTCSQACSICKSAPCHACMHVRSTGSGSTDVQGTCVTIAKQSFFLTEEALKKLCFGEHALALGTLKGSPSIQSMNILQRRHGRFGCGPQCGKRAKVAGLQGRASALKDCEERGGLRTPMSPPHSPTTGPPSIPGRQCMSAKSKPGSS